MTIVDTTELINLTDLGLHDSDLNGTQVTINSPDCIACCCTCESAIVLVTNEDSCRLKHSLFAGLRSAQVNSTLEYLAVANEFKLLVIDIVNRNCSSIHTKQFKEVNLGAANIELDSHVIHWTWIDTYQLAIVTHKALYTCDVSITSTIRHPAHSAIIGHVRPLLLPICKQFECNSRLTSACAIPVAKEITGDQMKIVNCKCDVNGLVYAITGHQETVSIDLHPQSLTYGAMDTRSLASSSVGSTSRLSRSMTTNSLAELSSLEHHSSFSMLTSTTFGLVQVHCKQRNRSQIIEAHAIAFSTSATSKIEQENDCTSSDSESVHEGPESPIMVVANRILTPMPGGIKIYYIEMGPSAVTSSSILNLSQLVAMPASSPPEDVPVSIECSSRGSHTRQLAFIITRHGTMNICDIYSASLLAQISLIDDPSPTVDLNLQSRPHDVSFLTSTLMVDKCSTCPSVMLIDSYSGRVTLTKVKADKLAISAAAAVAKRRKTPASAVSDASGNVSQDNNCFIVSTDQASDSCEFEMTRL